MTRLNVFLVITFIFLNVCLTSFSHATMSKMETAIQSTADQISMYQSSQLSHPKNCQHQNQSHISSHEAPHHLDQHENHCQHTDQDTITKNTIHQHNQMSCHDCEQWHCQINHIFMSEVDTSALTVKYDLYHNQQYSHYHTSFRSILEQPPIRPPRA